VTNKQLKLSTKKKHNHRSNEELLKEIEELKELNDNLKSLVVSILKMLGEKF
jgi:hypothetical protein